MSVTPVTARLLQTGYAPLDLTEYLSQETVPEITDAFEKPAETNAFVAPDVTVVGRDDAALTVTTRLRLLSPTGGDNTFEIWRGALRMFAGAIAPNTVSFDEQERSFTFTAFGLAKRLAEIDATPLFHRTGISGWTVVEAPNFSQVIITKAGAATCPFSGGDILAFIVPTTTDGYGVQIEGTRDELKVIKVIPSLTGEWTCSFANVPQPYAAGTTIELMTPYLRSARVQDVVTQCFQTALGGGAAVHFLTSAPGQVGDMFATPLPTDGLVGFPTSVVTSLDRYSPIAVGQSGAYKMAGPPTGTWTFDTYTNGQPAVDWWTNGGNGTFQLYGHRWDTSRSGPVDNRVTTYSYFAYQYDKPAPSCVRWLYQVSSTNVPDPSGIYLVDVTLRYQTSPDGKTWSGLYSPAGWADKGFTTNTDLFAYLFMGTGSSGRGPTSCGITYDTFSQCLFFIEPMLSGAAGTPIAFYLGRFNTATGTYTGGTSLLASPIRGVPAMNYSGALLLFSLDVLDDPVSGEINTPLLYGWNVSVAGALTLSGTVKIPATVAPHTLVYNAGTAPGTYVMWLLGGSETEGAYLLTIQLDGTGRVESTSIAPPGPVNAGSLGMCHAQDPATGVIRLVALVGNTLWWVAATSSEVIDYLDCDSLTLADVVSQCALLTDAVWYVDVSSGAVDCWYRSRQVASGFPVGADPALDDGGLLSLKSQPLWYRTYRYVSVTNERDDTVHGAAGDGGYQSGTMGLSMTARYAYPSSYCAAIARHVLAYLGRGLEFLDLMREDDGRAYQIGRTFTLPVRKPGKTFQITEVQRPALAGTVRIQAVEL